MNDHQQVIIAHIERLKNIDQDQRDELTDHYLTSYESKLERDIAPIDAMILTLDEIQGLKLISSTHGSYLLYAGLIVSIICATIWLSHRSSHRELISIPAATIVPSSWPISNEVREVSACYGNRLHPVFKKIRHHNGIDIKAQDGDAIIAPSGGVITELGYDKRQGNYIVMTHDDRYSTRYFHLSSFAVELDQEVSQGEIIGRVGNTGLSTSPHLHFEILECGLPVDPMLFLAP